MKNSHSFRAFTLIELLISIAIIALLTGIVVASLTPSKSRARDGKRISDVGQLQLALSLYFDRCKQYPSTLTTGASCTTSGGQTITLGDFIAIIPTAPSPSTYDYFRKTVSSSIVDYVLHVTLENYNEVIKDGLPATYSSGSLGSGWATGSGAASFTCINTSPGKEYCLGSK